MTVFKIKELSLLTKMSLCILLLVTLLTACSETDNKKESFPTIAVNSNAGKIPTAIPGPVSGAQVSLPLDEAPHDVITEWWYYTGHLQTPDGHKYGFEFVIFQGSRGTEPQGYASHFAITDLADSKFENGGYSFGKSDTANFYYEQTSSLPSNVKFGGTQGFGLNVNGWKLQGLGGNDHIEAAMTNSKYAIDLNLKDTQGIALHGGGEISYGPSGASYYYSRPFMSVSGTLTVNGQPTQITGQAWFDHQWGNFISTLSGGGWDWFSTQLSDGSALMFYQIKDETGKVIELYGSYILPCIQDCSPTKPLNVIELSSKDFASTKVTGTWRDWSNNITYPIAWNIKVVADSKRGIPDLNLNYNAALPNQELDTRKTTSNIYWEGDTYTTGQKNGVAINGNSYVELTGYDSNIAVK